MWEKLVLKYGYNWFWGCQGIADETKYSNTKEIHRDARHH